MTTIERLEARSLDELRGDAVQALNAAVPRFQQWVEKVRAPAGERGRFRFAVDSTREANCVMTFCVHQALRLMGIFDVVLSEQDCAESRRWFRGLHQGNGQYFDPALFDRAPPNWPEGEPYPSPAIRESVNGYCRGALMALGEGEEPPVKAPPAGWPQLGDSDKTILEWISTRPWYTGPWGACSHMKRMAAYVYDWCKQGKASQELLIEIIRFLYRIQDPDDGLWGSKQVPTNQRINGAFKLFGLIQGLLDLPLPHADRIADAVIAQMYRPDYDDHVGLCDELDNWTVLEQATKKNGGHRRELVEKLAAWRIVRVLEMFSQADGGFSYWPDNCGTAFCGIDMATPKPQGEAHAAALLTPAVNVCIRVLGIDDACAWRPQPWQPAKEHDNAELRQAILDQVFPDM